MRSFNKGISRAEPQLNERSGTAVNNVTFCFAWDDINTLSIFKVFRCYNIYPAYISKKSFCHVNTVNCNKIFSEFCCFFFFFFCSSFLFVSLLFFLSFCFAIFVSLFVGWLVVFCFAFWYFPYWNCKWTLFQFQLKKATIVWFSEGLTGFSFKTQLFTLEDNCRFKKRSNGNSPFLLIWFFRVNFRGHKRHYFPREIFWF